MVRHSTDKLPACAQVLRIWDAFFSQGLRILFGVGVALFLLAEEKLFHATTSAEVDECFRATETSCIDANALFALVFKDDLHISCTSLQLADGARSHVTD